MKLTPWGLNEMIECQQGRPQLPSSSAVRPEPQAEGGLGREARDEILTASPEMRYEIKTRGSVSGAIREVG